MAHCLHEDETSGFGHPGHLADHGEEDMTIQSLGTRGRRALLASTVAFSWFVANPMLPADFSGDGATLGAAHAKGGHHGGKHSTAGHVGHKSPHGKQTRHGKKTTSVTSTTDDDSSDDDSDTSDDDSADDSSDDSADDDSQT
jgi:hypothetical protein